MAISTPAWKRELCRRWIGWTVMPLQWWKRLSLRNDSSGPATEPGSLKRSGFMSGQKPMHRIALFCCQRCEGGFLEFVFAGAQHQIADGFARVFAFVQDQLHLLGDGHFDALTLRPGRARRGWSARLRPLCRPGRPESRAACGPGPALGPRCGCGSGCRCR